MSRLNAVVEARHPYPPFGGFLLPNYLNLMHSAILQSETYKNNLDIKWQAAL